jgi:hypothetical protein
MTHRAAVSAILAATFALSACSMGSPDANEARATTISAPHLLVELKTLPHGHPPVPGYSSLSTLPEGHPPVPGYSSPSTLPEGHPPVPGYSSPSTLPEGHPPVPGYHSAPALPEGHPRCPARGSLGTPPSDAGMKRMLQSQPGMIST